MVSVARKKWLLASVAVTLCAGVIVVLPRAQRAFAYQKQVSQPPAATKLAISPKVIRPKAAQAAQTINTLYSTFEVPADLFTKMKSHQTWQGLCGRHAMVRMPMLSEEGTFQSQLFSRVVVYQV